MTEYLKLRPANCKNCYKCIRHCPVKSISFSSDQANIIQEECILCGQCFVNCPQNAKYIRSDLDAAKELLAGSAPVYASIAPAFAANYEGATIGSMEKALRKLGFSGVEETAVGATIVKTRYDEMVDNGEQDVVISSCCHTVNLLIQKHYPGALPYIAKVLSPMQAHCADIKRRHPDARTVFIGPCISKKAEAEAYPGPVDCVLTFEELTHWMWEEDVSWEPEPDGREDSRARLFPTRGGILRTMKKNAKRDVTYIAIDGLESCIGALNDIISGQLTNCFVEMSACTGSCVGGPAMEQHIPSPLKRYIDVNQYAGHEDYPVEMPSADALNKDIPFIGVSKQRPGKSAIDDVLRKMNKTRPEHELNCGSCGYDTCRDKAMAVLQNKADLTMCLPYLMEQAQSFSDTIIKNIPNGIVVLNQALEIQQLNNAACKMMNIATPADVLGEQVVYILDPQPFLEVLRGGRNIYDRKAYLAEYQCYVEQTVLLDKSNKVIIVIMRDITEMEAIRSQREKTSRKTIEITDKVIEKQMRAVQEIASLLGETTAETKIALTNLKETLQDE